MVDKSPTHHCMRQKGSNNPVILPNEHNSHIKLTSHLKTGSLANGLRRHSLSCTWELIVSIYLHWTGGKMVCLCWHEVACSVTFHWHNTGGSIIFSWKSLIQSDSQLGLLPPPSPSSINPFTATKPFFQPPCHVTWIGKTHSFEWYHFKLIPISSRLRQGF